MNLKKSLLLVVGSAFAAALASAGTISFTCAANIDATVAGTCNSLNTTIADLYSSKLSNANADIYVEYAATGLGASIQFQNFVTYSTYLNALTAENGPGTVRASALASLPGAEPAIYTGGDIYVTAALAANLGITTDAFGDPVKGITVGSAACATVGVGGCYDAVIKLSNSPNIFYYRTGVQGAGTYDFYTTLEHETDEVLGTSSCINTSGNTLTNGCGGTDAGAADLFRYQSNGNRVFDSTTPGAYFSYNGGATNGANGFVYNTLSNGEDYADFLSSCPGGPFSVQDAEGCPDTSGLDITNDGGAEINILDAVGYNLSPRTATPEPGTVYLLGVGLVLAGYLRLRRGYVRSLKPKPTAEKQ